jgi:ribA/ribD-fused uncharacterized protein
MQIISEFKGVYSFLSNFHPSPIFYEGIVFPTNEHFFQAMKTADRDMWGKIARAGTPAHAKKAGRNLALRPDWDRRKVKVMLYGLRMKFMQRGLVEQLLNTGDATLVEGNWWHDNFWGDCNCHNCSAIAGHNMLGKLLMRVRYDISVTPSSIFWG